MCLPLLAAVVAQLLNPVIRREFQGSGCSGSGKRCKNGDEPSVSARSKSKGPFPIMKSCEQQSLHKDRCYLLCPTPRIFGLHLQIACASCYTSALLEAVGWITALVLAKHKVLVDILAVLANEEAGRLQRRRCDTELVNVWLARRHRRRVDVGFPWELGISVCGHLELL